MLVSDNLYYPIEKKAYDSTRNLSYINYCQDDRVTPAANDEMTQRYSMRTQALDCKGCLNGKVTGVFDCYEIDVNK